MHRPVGATGIYEVNWNITWAVALDVTSINFLIAYFATLYENIISLHVSLTFGTVLPNCVVDVSTINQFKARLDKFWLHQDILYDYTADLTGIGDRSVHVTKDE